MKVRKQTSAPSAFHSLAGFCSVGLWMISALSLGACGAEAPNQAHAEHSQPITAQLPSLGEDAAGIETLPGFPIIPQGGVEQEQPEEVECVPRPALGRDRCHPEEPAPPPPARGGFCDVEIMAKWLEFEEGQGFSEGKAEGSVLYTLTDARTGSVTSTRFPSSGSYKLAKDARFTLNGSLGTYRVPVNRMRQVEVCATFREHDGDVIDINGDDDVGTDCETMTLTCPQASDTELLHADLCRGGDCDKLKGAMSSSIRVLTADADGDCVENEDDYTPEPCDEALKGQLCRASVVYFHYGDGPITNLAQNLGTDLSKAMGGYDEVVLLIDSDQLGPFNLNPAALALADVVMPPTEENFFASLQDVTAQGCDMDVWMFSHGTIEWIAEDDLSVVNGGGSISAISDDDGVGTPDITTDELAEDTNPLNSGTSSVPVRMTYGTPCFYNEWTQTWLDAGAKVSMGAKDIGFFPVFYGNFADGWNTGATYGGAAAGEYSAVDEALVFGLIEAQGVLPPWLCVGNSVLGTNSCAEDFFVDSDLMATVDAAGQFNDGPDDSKYWIGGPLWDTAGIAYDSSLSGVDNMRASSTKVLGGNPNVTKSVPPTLRWP